MNNMRTAFASLASLAFAATGLGGCTTVAENIVKIQAGIPGEPRQQTLADSCIDKSVSGQTTIVVHDGKGGDFAYAFLGVPTDYVPIAGQVKMADGMVVFKTAYDARSIYLNKVETEGMKIDYYGNNLNSLPSEYTMSQNLAQRASHMFGRAKAVYYAKGDVADCTGQYVVPNPSESYPVFTPGWDEYRYVWRLERSIWRSQTRPQFNHRPAPSRGRAPR